MGFGDIFRTFFGGGFGGTERSSRGQDLAYDLEITLEEAAKGVDKEIEIPRTETLRCMRRLWCSSGYNCQSLPPIGGAGQVQVQHRSKFRCIRASGCLSSV